MQQTNQLSLYAYVLRQSIKRGINPLPGTTECIPRCHLLLCARSNVVTRHSILQHRHSNQSIASTCIRGDGQVACLRAQFHPREVVGCMPNTRSLGVFLSLQRDLHRSLGAKPGVFFDATPCRQYLPTQHTLQRTAHRGREPRGTVAAVHLLVVLWGVAIIRSMLAPTVACQSVRLTDDEVSLGEQRFWIPFLVS
eukprot:m.128682 g.128682  ORF g.128682 m.128682 type:complete len:195 (-) comp17439_c0_seq1:834-1418(-)